MDIQNELIAPVRDILGFIHHLTQKPVKFVEKPDLETYAGVRIARSTMPEHIVVYKTEHSELINHLIAHECGHIRRIYETSPEKRFMVVSNDDHKYTGMAVFEKDLGNLANEMGIETAGKLANMWYSGLMRQVTNLPVDLMIEKWLYEEYPTLRTLQINSLSNQNDLALQGLNKRVKEMTPSFVFKTGNLMNAAYTSLLSKIIKIKLVREWKRTDFYAESMDLANLLDIENGWLPERDREIVDIWAKKLNLNSWFTWHPFEDVPLSYYKT